MGNRLYVGNLSYQINTEDLRQAFANAGVGTVIDAKVLTDRETGQSRGFGFVTMSTDAEAKEAIQAMDGYSLGGRALRVNEAEDRPARAGGGGGGRSGPQVYQSGGGGGGGGGGGRGPQVYQSHPGGGASAGGRGEGRRGNDRRGGGRDDFSR